MPLSLGDPLPNLHLPATGGKVIHLAQLRGTPLVLFFYPRAGTPGCTQEGRDFRDISGDFTVLKTRILGASRDGLKAQDNFKTKQGFPFDLLSDTEERLCGLFDVIKVKQMYGRQVRGIERSTFLFDAAGLLHREWRKVQVKGHVAEVLDAVRLLQAEGR
jgi:thioredoxin-dependent peroxiredoxin